MAAVRSLASCALVRRDPRPTVGREAEVGERRPVVSGPVRPGTNALALHEDHSPGFIAAGHGIPANGAYEDRGRAAANGGALAGVRTVGRPPRDCRVTAGMCAAEQIDRPRETGVPQFVGTFRGFGT